jgi:hypothetical protein
MLTDQIAARRAWQDIKAAYDDEFQAHVALTIDALDLEAPVGSGVTNVRTSVT